MSNYLVVLDTAIYTKKEQGSLRLRGWMYTGTEMPVVQARADKEDVECCLVRFPRPDVIEARRDLDFGSDLAGFEIKITDLEEIITSGKVLRIRVCIGEETFPVYQKTSDQMQKSYEEDACVIYNIDRSERRDHEVHIEGWYITFEGPIQLELRDEEDAVIQEVSWRFAKREDVRAEYDAGADEVFGFMADVARDQIHGEKITLVLSREGFEKKHTFDLRQIDRENKKSYKLKKLLGRSNAKKNWKMLREDGVRGFIQYLWKETNTYENYPEYLKQMRPSRKELKAQGRVIFEEDPLFSIVVPLYHTPIEYLKALLDSICAQSYGNWELCLADGSGDNALGRYIEKEYRGESRIRYKLLKENAGIAGNTNAALEMARGDYIVFADHDDVLEPHALYEAACAFRDNPGTELVYSDEDLVNQNGVSFYPHFKPDFNLEYLHCINYMCHLLVVKTELYKRVGGIRSEFDGAQDYDFILRCVEKTNRICHIPRVLYHWRSHEGSTAGNQESKLYAVEAGKKALEQHYERLGLEAEVEYTGTFIVFRTRYRVQGNPKVSILIPNKDHIKDLDLCVRSIIEKSTWNNYEIIIIENNSEEEKTFTYYKELETRYAQVKVVYYEGYFNYSAINNFGAKYADGDYFLLLNNDTEVITPNWMEIMLGFGQLEETGVVGAKLYYPDDTIQHAGIVIGLGGFGGHVHAGLSKIHVGYMGRLITSQEISAVTGACMLIKRSVYEELHGLNESFAVALNDVDFCLRVREHGWKIIFAADAELYHYESKSRGYEDTAEKKARFQEEVDRFKKRFETILSLGDPYYNPNMTLEKGDCTMRKSHEEWKGI